MMTLIRIFPQDAIAFYLLIFWMPLEMTLLLGITILILLLSLLKIEKMVKLTFGSYLLLAFSLACGSLIVQEAQYFQVSPQEKLLGIGYEAISTFLLNAQPTLMLLFSALGLRFFAQHAHLTIRIASDLVEKKLQTFLRGILSLISLLSFLYYPLAFFKGAIYEWLFLQESFVGYTSRIPLITCVGILFTL